MYKYVAGTVVRTRDFYQERPLDRRAWLLQANTTLNMPVIHHTPVKNGLSVPPLGLGLMGLSGGYGTPPSDEERFQFLDRALQLGATFWDTSE